MNIKWLMSFGLVLGSWAMADDIRLGEPGYGGTGCPAGSASVTLSPDAKTLSIIFDRYQTTVGGDTRRSIDRKSCSIAIPVHVPQGFSVSVLQVDFRGYNYLPYGANSQFNVEYFFAGSAGPRYQRRFYGELDDDYLVSNELELRAMVWSRCGQDVNLRTNSSITLRTTYNREAMSTIDSEDINAGIIYQLQWKRCD